MRRRHETETRGGSVLMEFAIAFPIVLVLVLACAQFAHLCLARQIAHYAAYCAARAALVTVCDEGGPDGNNDSWPRAGGLDSELKYEGMEEPYRQGETRVPPGVPVGSARTEAEWAACQAAFAVCAWAVMGGADAPANDHEIPGWGRVPGSNAVKRKTRAIIDRQPWNVVATVEHDFALVFPIIGPMIAWGMNPWDETQPWAIQNEDMTANTHIVSGRDLVPYPHIRIAETVTLPKPYRTVMAAGDWDGHPPGAHHGSGW